MVQDTNEDEDGAQQGCKAKFNKWWSEFKLKIWDGEKKEFIGRTASSWACILLFYVAFFAFTAGYFAVCFSIFMRTIDSKVPTHQGYYSILKFNPGMNYVPKPSSANVVKFSTAKNDSFMDRYVLPLEHEIERYANATNLMMCNGETSSTFDEACRFNVSTLGKECSSENAFGYPDGKPCFLLRINNVYGWNPAEDVFKPNEIGCRKDDNSNECQFSKIPQNFKTSVDLHYIPISCTGEETMDEDNLIKVEFSPPNGIPTNFYPYYHQTDFLPPIVAVKFTVTKGVHVSIVCKFWTRNVKHNNSDRQGSLIINLMVDEEGKVDNTNASNVSTESKNGSPPLSTSSSMQQSASLSLAVTRSTQVATDVTSEPKEKTKSSIGASIAFGSDEITTTVNIQST